jgi:hypothetical protein
VPVNVPPYATIDYQDTSELFFRDLKSSAHLDGIRFWFTDSLSGKVLSMTQDWSMVMKVEHVPFSNDDDTNIRMMQLLGEMRDLQLLDALS